jgi:hypothetical protein
MSRLSGHSQFWDTTKQACCDCTCFAGFDPAIWKAQETDMFLQNGAVNDNLKRVN